MKINVYPVEEQYGGDFMKFCINKAKLPEWYKKSESFIEKSTLPYAKDKSMTIKKCTPVLDFLSSGLTLSLPFAIYANGKYPNREISSTLQGGACQLGHHHPGQLQNFPISSVYDPNPLKIDFPFYIEAPPGYSALFINSIPYKEWPLLFVEAIVQSDKYKGAVNFPFLIRKDFEGKIDAGTEFMRVFFIKREELELIYNNKINPETSTHATLVQSLGAGFYKKLRLNQIF